MIFLERKNCGIVAEELNIVEGLSIAKNISL